jgi:hypothetical protein
MAYPGYMNNNVHLESQFLTLANQLEGTLAD